MAMMGTGFMEMLIMLALMTGGGNIDIVSSLPAKEYFKARNIEISADKLMEFATQTPDSGKKQFVQLISLSHLASDPDLLKKSAKLAEHRRLLGEIAQGKKANDATGFAAQYAEKALVALDGQKLPPPGRRPWKDSIKYLPDDANFVALIDLASAQSAERKAPDLTMILNLIPPQEKEKFWSAVENIGNYQVDSISVALNYGADGNQISHLVARFTGKGNPDWFADAIKGDFKEDAAKNRVGPDGEKIRVLTSDRDGPAITIVGDREVLVGGYPPEFNRGAPAAKKNHQEVIDRLLAQRAKASLGPLQGLLKADLTKIPADANGLVVGNLTKEMRNGPFPMPVKVTAFAKRIAGGMDIHAQGAMADEMAAKGFIETVGNGRNQAIQELNKAQGQPFPIPGFNPAVFVGLLESIQLQSNGSEAQFRMLLPDDSMLTLPMMFGMTFAARAQVIPAQAVPAQKVEVKKEEKK
jgi:hypothetical protein